MKDGTLTVVLVLVAVSVIATVINVAVQHFTQDYITETALLSVGSDSETVQGVFIRNEKVINYNGKGVISYEVSDGGKLGIGSPIATVYSSETQIELKQRIAALEKDYALLERISNPGTAKTAQPSGLSELFTQHYKEFLYRREQGDLAALPQQSDEMVVLLSTYQLVTGQDGALDRRMHEIQAEIESLKARQEEPLDTITAEEAAYFVSYADGYENELDLNMLEEITPQMLASIKDSPTSGNGIVGKLVDGYRWALACVVDNSEKIYQQGQRVSLKFASTSEVVRGTVELLMAGNTGKQTVAVITCDAMTHDLVQHRTDTVEVIRGEYQGILVPRSSLHFKEIENDEGRMETVRGVYILSGEQPEFRRLNVIYEGSDYVITAQTSDPECLMLYDSIITKGIDADGQ
ncbi:MAG: hypothetical protein K6F80_01080 [Oscillospiraceae bacterium]|nr:hypothetical protein [Oscillospiraceae bacterium]